MNGSSTDLGNNPLNDELANSSGLAECREVRGGSGRSSTEDQRDASGHPNRVVANEAGAPRIPKITLIGHRRNAPGWRQSPDTAGGWEPEGVLKYMGYAVGTTAGLSAPSQAPGPNAMVERAIASGIRPGYLEDWSEPLDQA